MSVYSIAAYGAMIGDAARLSAYRAALQRAITPGCTVLDLGTGTGIHALMACELGAGKVFAIETSEAIQVARQIATDNGFADRIEFIHDSSERVTLPEPADVMVSDLRGVLPFYGRHLPSVFDARDRMLRADGAMVPRQDSLWVAPVSTPEIYDAIVAPWADDAVAADLSAARNMVTQHLHRRRIRADQLICPGQQWADINYLSGTSHDARGSVDFDIEEACSLHGFALWFDATLDADSGFSNAPGEAELIYGMYFAPLPRPTDLVAGDSVGLALRADLVGDDYVWRWSTRVRGASSVDFEQSTFHGAPIARKTLELTSTDARPGLARDGEVDLAVLGMIDGTTSIATIVDHLLETFPGEFTDRDSATDRVALLVRRYGS